MCGYKHNNKSFLFIGYPNKIVYYIKYNKKLLGLYEMRMKVEINF